MSDLTELGLKKPAPLNPPVAPAAPAAPARPVASAVVEPFADRRPDGLSTFLDRVLELLGQLAPESDAGEVDTFRASLEQYRDVIIDPRRKAEWPEVADACIDLCRTYLRGSRAYLTEREQELSEVIAILREAAKLSVGHSADFHAQVLASSERFTRLAELENIREMRKRMGDEVGTLRKAVSEKQQRDDQAYAQLTSRVETLQQKLAEMEVEAAVDPLTKVGNRRRFQTALSRMVAAAQQPGSILSLAMIDVDHFKKINDTHGHPIGDRVLVCVAQWIAKDVRQTDVVARYGGEEFAVLLPGASVAEVEARFRQLLTDIAGSAYEYDALGRTETVRFTVSCGLVDLEPNETEDAFLKRADEALYEAKRKGRNRVVARKKGLLGRMIAWG